MGKSRVSTICTTNYSIDFFDNHAYFCQHNGCWTNKKKKWDESERRVARDVIIRPVEHEVLSVEELEQKNGEMAAQQEEQEVKRKHYTENILMNMQRKSYWKYSLYGIMHTRYLDTKLSNEQQIFEDSFAAFKRRLFNLHRRHLLLVHFENNKKEHFMKYNVNIIPHNEIFRTFRKMRALNQNIEEFMLVWSRADVMGCSEGRVEGDVKCGDDRLKNRWRLLPEKFRMEHTIRDILRIVPM
eukprot:243007_1